jgi:McrBC 5-methylcytosine restriction system component
MNRVARPKRLNRPLSKPLWTSTDHGSPIVVDADYFAPPGRDRGWCPQADAFLRFNEAAFRELSLEPTLKAGREGPSLHLVPAGRAGAVPLRSPQTGQVVAGVVVKPRFGWSGVGAVLGEIGWHAAPRFCELPLVPGSGREVPPWVIAGPVIARLSAMLAALRRGYEEVEADLVKPKGRILWTPFIQRLAAGHWQAVPCRFSELGQDSRLRSNVRWALETVGGGLRRVGAGDRIAAALCALIRVLLEGLDDVVPIRPVARLTAGTTLLDSSVFTRGIEALGWVADERGLGGGRELDGLAWTLELDRLWESYVETLLNRECALSGESMLVGRKGQNSFPIAWDRGSSTLRQLVPDFVLRRGHSIRIVDAKYKAHFAEIDESGWRRLSDEIRNAHRADVHQVLAYAALYEATEIQVELVYPLRRTTFEALHARGMDTAQARLLHGSRNLLLRLRGVPFGTALEDT